MQTLKHMTLSRLQAEQALRQRQQLRLVQITSPRHRPLPTRIAIVIWAMLVSAIVLIVLIILEAL
jgi:hypothetical protein